MITVFSQLLLKLSNLINLPHAVSICVGPVLVTGAGAALTGVGIGLKGAGFALKGV